MQRGHRARPSGAAAWPRRALLYLLLPLALLAAQTLGLWHGVLHPHAGGIAPHPHAGVVAHPAVTAATAHGQADARGANLAHHDDGSALCRLIDHLAHADVLLAAPIAALVAPAHGSLPVHAPTGLAASTASPYEARGPPAPLQV